MRHSTLQDLERLTRHFNLVLRDTHALDVGGTPIVHLDHHESANPLGALHRQLDYLDAGYNESALGSAPRFTRDLLDRTTISDLIGRYDFVHCFDTLEHVSDPVTFACHLLVLLKPTSHLYLTTVFWWMYHPSPRDYYRFTPDALVHIFRQASVLERININIRWCGWGSDPRGVCILIQRHASAPACIESTELRFQSIHELAIDQLAKQ